MVQRNRPLSDTHGIEIGDLEGLVWDLTCVGEYICRADCLGARAVVTVAVLLLRTSGLTICVAVPTKVRAGSYLLR